MPTFFQGIDAIHHLVVACIDEGLQCKFSCRWQALLRAKLFTSIALRMLVAPHVGFDDGVAVLHE